MQQIQLSIPEPCHEDWQNMNPTEQGRFCNACAKQVVDFSTMSDREVLNYFSTIKNEKVCGRAYPDQLERAITMPKDPKKRLFWHWNYITMLFLFFSKTNTAKAQLGKVAFSSSKADSIKQAEIKKALSGEAGCGIASNSNNVIKGKITDESGAAIAGASVVVKGAKTGTSTDQGGFYKIIINPGDKIIQVSAIGFETKEIALANIHTSDIILTKMESSLTGEVVIVGGMISTDEYYIPADKPKHIAILEVTDNATMQPVNKATLIIKKRGIDKADVEFTDKKGTYKLKKIRENDSYNVTITAEGYLTQELEIKGYDFDERKVIRQIFLEKAPLPEDFKKMDAVIINSYESSKRICRMGGVSSVSTASIQKTNLFRDTLISVATKITGALKIAPNPVQKGNTIKLTLKLKETGVYNIQITDAAGRIVVQKQSTATAKQYIEEVPTNSSWGSGVYYVSIYGSNQKMISTSNFIIQ
ncbi:carboxypeptidase-like regulatory domain-containing protein [Ferruginibacter profundus]